MTRDLAMTSVANNPAPPTLAAAEPAALRARRAGPAGPSPHFSSVLKVADAASDRRPLTRADQAYQQAQELVALTLVQPVLDQVRNDPLKSPLFHGGFGEEAFGRQLDAIFARHITQKSRLPLVDAVYRQITAARPSPAAAPSDARRTAGPAAAPASQELDVRG